MPDISEKSTELGQYDFELIDKVFSFFVDNFNDQPLNHTLVNDVRSLREDFANSYTAWLVPHDN